MGLTGVGIYVAILQNQPTTTLSLPFLNQFPVWLIVLVRYQLHPKRYLWLSIRHFEPHLYPLASVWDAPDREERVGENSLLLTERKQL